MESSPGLFTLMSILTCTTLFLKQNTTDLLFPVMSFTYCKICNCIIVVYWHQRTWHVICHQLLNIESQHLENPHKYVVFYPLVLFFALSSLSHALLAALELSQSGSCVSCHYWSLCPISCYWSGVKHSCPKLMIIPAVEEQFWQTVQRSNTTIIIIMSFLADHQITFTRTEEHKHPNVKVEESQWSLDDRADSLLNYLSLTFSLIMWVDLWELQPSSSLSEAFHSLLTLCCPTKSLSVAGHKTTGLRSTT